MSDILLTMPLTFRLAKWLQHRRIPGGFRLEQFMRKRGLINFLVRYSLSERMFIDVPIGLPSRNYDAYDIAKYEQASIDCVKAIVVPWKMPVTLIDCGADIGIMSVKYANACPNISRVVSFEPNPAVYAYLWRNIGNLPIDGEARCQAVADYTGKGQLMHPSHDASDHASFLARAVQGKIDVVSIDSLNLSGNGGLLLKIDVEGGELAVLKGARKTIGAFEKVVVIFEAHPKQVLRTGIDPVEIITFIKSIRACNVRVSELPTLDLALSKPFFAEVPTMNIYNICVYDA